MRNIVFSFSPAGGTQKVAEAIGKQIGCGVADITTDDFGTAVEADARVFFCFPVYGGRIPKPLNDRMKHITGKGTPTILVAVYGNHTVGDALLEMQDVCTRQGFKVFAAGEMIAPHSLDKSIGKGRPDASDLAKLSDFVEKVMADTEFQPVKVPGNPKYKRSLPVPVHPTGGIACVRCGVCVDNCPMGAIDGRHPTRTNHLKCIGCMRCVNLCTTGTRKIPLLLRPATHVALTALCKERKEPKFYY